MGMYAFKLTLLFCSLTIYKSLHAAGVLENSSDLWRNWLLNENEEVPSQQSPPLSRRITPKSVFIAPVFDKCPSGTRLDAMGKCVKIVRIDKWENLVNKLNAAFAQTSSKPIATSNETSTTTRASLSTFSTTTLTTMSSTTTTTTTTRSTTEVDVPNSTFLLKESQPANTTTDIPAADISGPLQLSIPFNSKNFSEETYDEISSSSIRTNVTNPSNERDIRTTTYAVQNPSELTTNKFDLADTTISPSFDVTLSTVYPDANTAESAGSVLPDAEYSTEMTTESTTIGDFPTETTSLPKRYYVHRRPVQEQVTSKSERIYITSRRPAASNEPKLTVTPVADLVYSYTGGDILKIPVRFPEYVGENKSSTDRALLNRIREYHKENSLVLSTFHNGAVSMPNISDISDSTSTVSDSSSINNSNNLIISSNSASNDPYQKLPSNGKIRPKCDPSTGYGDCSTSPSKLDTLTGTGTDKGSYVVNVNRGSVPPVTTIIRFPSAVYPKGTSVVRFPTSGSAGSSIIADQQFKPSSNVDETVAFPEMEIGAASRYWESNRFPASYWNPWDASKPHFVRVWPSNVGTPVTTTYNLGGDINYNYRSQADYV